MKILTLNLISLITFGNSTNESDINVSSGSEVSESEVSGSEVSESEASESEASGSDYTSVTTGSPFTSESSEISESESENSESENSENSFIESSESNSSYYASIHEKILALGSSNENFNILSFGGYVLFFEYLNSLNTDEYNDPIGFNLRFIIELNKIVLDTGGFKGYKNYLERFFIIEKKLVFEIYQTITNQEFFDAEEFDDFYAVKCPKDFKKIFNISNYLQGLDEDKFNDFIKNEKEENIEDFVDLLNLDDEELVKQLKTGEITNLDDEELVKQLKIGEITDFNDAKLKQAVEKIKKEVKW